MPVSWFRIIEFTAGITCIFVSIYIIYLRTRVPIAPTPSRKASNANNSERISQIYLFRGVVRGSEPVILLVSGILLIESARNEPNIIKVPPSYSVDLCAEKLMLLSQYADGGLDNSLLNFIRALNTEIDNKPIDDNVRNSILRGVSDYPDLRTIIRNEVIRRVLSSDDIETYCKYKRANTKPEASNAGDRVAYRRVEHLLSN